MRTAKASLHNHLRTSSYITEKTVNRAVEKASERLGEGGVLGVINFNPSIDEIDPRWNLFINKLKYDKINTWNGVYIPEKDILAVRGQEVPTKEGYHILLIGTTLDQNAKNGSSLEEVLNLGRKFNAIIEADHPFGRHGVGRFLQENPEFYFRFDGYETSNGIISERENKMAREEYGKIKDKYVHLFESVSDDGHSIYEIGRSYSNIKMPSDYKIFKDFPERVVEALKEGYNSNKDGKLGDKRTSCRIGAIDHIADLAVLIKAKQYLGWDPNKKTAPLLERFGIRV